jgi:cellulose synthase/poly-beta-1,6-N-acetylglucosamine synthase-like glycosyltransferase
MVLFILIFFLLFVAYAIIIDKYRRTWNRLPEFVLEEKIFSTFISVIIPARNEAGNINNLLSSLEQQQYPADLFEVIIIDDHSNDDTWKLLSEFKTQKFQYRCLKLEDHIAQLPASGAFKKQAIAVGISQAKGDLIVTSDADCEFNPEWLESIAAYYETTDAACMAAPVALFGKRGLLEVFQSLDVITMQGITAAAVSSKLHMMCNGANFIYKKKVFEQVGGFSGIDNIPSGDDMLLMQKIHERYPEKIFFLKSKSAIVQTAPTCTWREFLNQRIRWSSKAGHYKNRNTSVILLLVYLFNLCFLVLLITLIWKPYWAFLLLLFFIGKIIIEFPFVQTVATFFDKHRLMKFFPLLQPLHILYIIIAGWLGIFGSYKWKGRKIDMKATKQFKA